ncbi:hypothetical protein GCM10023191_019830 [Actinoallomurus oryzae]|uniref:Uncharacterized protein n=1 Tax=Actinoallomurus oryzae TaxID=502180 RepID=A0ABP8PLF7_9ACTN
MDVRARLPRVGAGTGVPDDGHRRAEPAAWIRVPFQVLTKRSSGSFLLSAASAPGRSPSSGTVAAAATAPRTPLRDGTPATPRVGSDIDGRSERLSDKRVRGT